MKLQSAALAMAIALAMISGACNPTGTTPSGSAGSSGGGTSGSTGTAGPGGPRWPAGAPCGGDVVGTWNVTSSCVALSGALDVSLIGLDPRTCKVATISGSISVNGTWTANANGTYTDGTTTTGTAKVELEAGCKILSNTPLMCSGIDSPLTAVGFSDAPCVDAASGGGCTCTGTVNQMGSIGWMTLDPQKNGNYVLSGSTLTADQIAKYGDCVAGDKLTLIPQPTGFTATGTIVLQKSSTSGSAGASGSAGSAGTNGTAGTHGKAGTSARHRARGRTAPPGPMARRAPAAAPARVYRRPAGAVARTGRPGTAAPPDAVARW